MESEDSATASQAGRSPTFGPLDGDGVAAALTRAFADTRVEECIVQVWRDGPSGVVFSLSEGEALVEYSVIHGGVTSGKVNPFAAVLPCGSDRYRELTQAIQRIHAACGPCDLEFVGLERPAFVQLRPITASFTYDRELVALKLALQERDEPDWERTEFCVDLMERPEIDGALIAVFLEVAETVWTEIQGRRPTLPKPAFLKIGRQLFAAQGLQAALRLTLAQRLRLGLRYATALAEIRRDLAPGSFADTARLMRASLLLNLYTDLFAKHLPATSRKLFRLRERCRQELERLLPRAPAPVDIPFERRLAPRIVRDDARAVWTELSLDDSLGAIVVPGEFESGPFFLFRGRIQDVPAGVVLLTEELYPQLSEVLAHVSGVVAAGGGFGSHLAILAREQGVPLMIQAPDFVRRNAAQALGARR